MKNWVTVSPTPNYWSKKMCKIKNNRIRTKICDLMSDMLNNPVVNEHGIYPTTKFMSAMEDFCLELRHEAIGWTWAQACCLLDVGTDPRKYDQADLLSDAKRDLDKELEQK